MTTHSIDTTPANPLQVEMIASAALASWGESRHYAESRDPFFFDLIDELEAEGDSDALTMLRGLEAVSPPSIAEYAGSAADALTTSGVVPAECLDGLGTARPVRAWISQDADSPDQACVFVEFAYPAGHDHTIAVFVEDGRAKHIACLGAMSRVPPPAFALDSTDPVAAGAMLIDALDATDQIAARQAGQVEKLRLGALVYARARSLVGPS
jgi:hypothetical protein